MREIVFLVTTERPGHIEATAPDRSLQVQAASLEELHHEAREALIQQLGPAHCAYRIRIRRSQPQRVHAIRPLRCQPALCN